MKQYLFLFMLILMGQFALGQNCTSCNTNITANDTLNYTVGSGQLFCISNNGNFNGVITINGGTVCVAGNFNPKSITINSGVINNYGNSSINTSVTLGSGFSLNNFSGAIVNISGSLTLNSAIISNAGIFNVVDNLINTGSITNSSIINCNQISGAGTLNDTGIINSN